VELGKQWPFQRKNPAEAWEPQRGRLFGKLIRMS
jgi:hypothetical protein